MIRVVRGELADTTAEAVLRPVTAEWTPVTTAMRRLEAAAGPEPDALCRRLGELPVGSAVITGAGDLAAQFMIHVIVRSVDEPVTEAGVKRALQNGLRRATEWGITHMALPPLGTGAGNLDADDAAALMIETLTTHMTTVATLATVEIHVESDYEMDVFTRRVQAIT